MGKKEVIDYKKKLREVVNNFFFSGGTQLINLGINFLLTILVARWLGKVALGKYIIALSLSSIVFGFVNFGLVGILVREVSKNLNNIYQYLPNCLGIRLLISIPAGIVICITLGICFRFDIESLLIILITSCYVGISGVVNVFYGVFQAVGKFDLNFKINLFYKLSSLLWAVILLLFGFKIISLISLFLFLQVINVLIAGILVNNRICKIVFSFNFKFWKEYIRESLPLSMTGSAEAVNLKFDSILLGSMIGEFATGIYNSAYSIYLGATYIPYGLIVAYYPTYSREYAKNVNQGKKLFKTFFFLLTVSGILVTLITSNYSEEIITFVFGSNYLEGHIALKILAFAFPLIILNRFCNYTLYAIGLQTHVFIIVVVCAFMNILLNIIIIPKYSYLGASMTTVVTEGIILLLGLYFVIKKS